MKTLRKINRPIKFFGLSSGQFGVYMLAIAVIIVVCIFKRLHPLIIVGMIGVIYFASNFLFKILNREHKAGNPDYLSGLSIKTVTPPIIIDKHKIFNLILKRK